jgi:hypothetical protein
MLSISPYIVHQVALHPFVCYLRMSVCLWMVTSSHSQLSSHQPKQLLLECIDEAPISITDYLLWKTMKFENISEK